MPKEVANSSVISASFGSLTSCTVHSNTAALPANSDAPYSSGKETSTSFLSPALQPTSCSSKPGMNWPEPSSRSKPSPAPPSKASPSMRPIKSIFTRSPSWALAVLARATKSLRLEARRSSASSTRASSTSTTGFSSFSLAKSVSSIGGMTS